MSHPTRILIASFLTLVACSGDPVEHCEDYVAALDSCIKASAGTTSTAVLVDTPAFCLPYGELEGDEATAAIDAFDCARGAYEQADCSNPVAVSEATLDANSCLTGS